MQVQICGAQVSKQPNGNAIYVVFEGTEQQIVDAFNTLYNANAFSGELEFLHNGLAITTAEINQFQRGLFNRECFHLMDNPDVCQTNKAKNALERKQKAHKGGFVQLAKQMADSIYENIPSVRVIMPNETVLPYCYKFGSHGVSDADMSGRD